LGKLANLISAFFGERMSKTIYIICERDNQNGRTISFDHAYESQAVAKNRYKELNDRFTHSQYYVALVELLG
jgi:hypothetical protein